MDNGCAKARPWGSEDGLTGKCLCSIEPVRNKRAPSTPPSIASPPIRRDQRTFRRIESCGPDCCRATQPDGGSTTIVLADDHAVVRRGLRMLLEEAGFEIAAEAGDVGATRRKVRAYKPNVLLLDLNMPGGSSLHAIPQLLEASPGTAMVVLTMEGASICPRSVAQRRERVRAQRGGRLRTHWGGTCSD